MDGHQFERCCAELLRSNGFTSVEVTSGSGDFGIDVLASKRSASYAIQCKCYSQPVGNHAVQEAYSGAAYYKRQVPVVMTNQTFTAAAIQMAAKTGVTLWGRTDLQKFICIHNRLADQAGKYPPLLRYPLFVLSFLPALATVLMGNSFRQITFSSVFAFLILWGLCFVVARWISKFASWLGQILDSIALCSRAKVPSLPVLESPPYTVESLPDPPMEADPMLTQAIETVLNAGFASTSLLQRRCKLGYARAAHILDEMEQYGIIGPCREAKPREILGTRQEAIRILTHLGDVKQSLDVLNSEHGDASFV